VALGAATGVVLLWFTTISVFLLNVCGNNYSKVFIYDGCLGGGSVTVFIFCLLEVIVGAWFLRRYFLPLLFGRENYASFDKLKQEKLVGFIAQIVVRSSCCVQLMTILLGGWGLQLSMESGLFSQFNAKMYYHKLVETGESTTCQQAGMHHADVAALRTWYLAKYHMIAVHLWELAYIPGLTLDTWLHNLFLVLIAAMASQPEASLSDGHDQALVDAVGFSFILGASMNSLVKSCVVMYHYTAPNHIRQARWMEASIGGANLITLCFYFGFPIGFIATHWSRFGVVTVWVLLLSVLFLTCVEIRLVIVKRSIARAARRKAAVAKSSVAAVSLTFLCNSGTDAKNESVVVVGSNDCNDAILDSEKFLSPSAQHGNSRALLSPGASAPLSSGVAQTWSHRISSGSFFSFPLQMVEALQNQDEDRKLSLC